MRIEMQSLKRTGFLLLSLVVLVSLSGCSSKVKPVENAGFTDAALMNPDPLLPFHEVWVSPDFDKSQYGQLYVAPVSTAYMLDITNWQEGERRNKIEEDVAQLAVYTREAVKKSFRDDASHRFRVVNSPNEGSSTLILEIAITEVVPSKVTLNALGYVPFGIGAGIKVVRKLASDTSTVAFEARVSDPATGRVVIMLADRNAQQTALVSGKDLTWYGHSHGIIDNWSKKLVAVANRKPGEKVKETKSLTLKAW